jgi:membrane-associated phospholipid phosphatase
MKRAKRWGCVQDLHILHHWTRAALRAVLLVIALLVGMLRALPQQVGSDPGIRNPELVTNSQSPTPNPQLPNPNPQYDRPISWKQLFPNIVHDQKCIWLFPASVARGRHLKPTLGIIFATAGLVALDPHDDPYFRRTSSFGRFNKVFSGNTMALGTAMVPLSFYAVGLARRDSFAQHTSLLAGEAVADAEILTTVMKNIDRRLRPIEIDPHGDFSHTWFKSHGTLIGGRGSFPSGHTIAAFSVATVFADRYRRHRPGLSGTGHRWVPWVAYGLASLVGFSRITLQAHFPSDVFMGAALGYVISHDVVMQQK